MRDIVECAVQLAHLDRLGVDDVVLHVARGLHVTHCLREHLVAVRLAGVRLADKHEAVAHHDGLVELRAVFKFI